MAKQRLINCDFMNNMTKVSNKAKLLYYTMFINADDRGFVGNAEDIIKNLNGNESDDTMALLENDYSTALNELVDKGLLYSFNSKHSNNIYLIRHWYFHNKYRSGLWTGYYGYLQQVEIINNEYILKEEKGKPFKEKNKLNEMKLNEIKLNEIKDSSLETFLKQKGVNNYLELTEEERKEWNEMIQNSIEDDDPLPF
jgi:hypothetical protein